LTYQTTRQDTCPVSQLATQAAGIVRALYALTPAASLDWPSPEPYRDLPDVFHDQPTEPTPQGLRDHLTRRLDAIIEFAQFAFATSKRGALFQLILAGRTFELATFDCTLDGMVPCEAEQILEVEKRGEALIVSALGALDDGSDPDLTVLRAWLFDTRPYRGSRGYTLAEALETR